MKRTIATIIATITLAAPSPALAPTVDAATGRCQQWEQLLLELAPAGGWNIAKMSRTAWRESRCIPTAVNQRGGDSGLLQIHPVSWPWLSTKLGVTVTRSRLLEPAFNIRAAAALCTYWRKATRSQAGCYRPWRGGA